MKPFFDVHLPLHINYLVFYPSTFSCYFCFWLKSFFPHDFWCQTKMKSMSEVFNTITENFIDKDPICFQLWEIQHFKSFSEYIAVFLLQLFIWNKAAFEEWIFFYQKQYVLCDFFKIPNHKHSTLFARLWRSPSWDCWDWLTSVACFCSIGNVCGRNRSCYGVWRPPATDRWHAH